MRNACRIALFALALIGGAMVVSHADFVFGANDGPRISDAQIKEIRAEIEQRKEKIAALEDKIKRYEKQAEQKRLESVSLSNQMGLLDNSIGQVEIDIEATNEKIETLTLEIEALQLEIQKTEQAIERQKQMLAEFMRNIYQHGDKSVIEILAAYDSFSEFYNQIQYMRTVEQDIARSSQTLKSSKLVLAGKRDELDSQRENYDTLKGELSARKADLEEQRQYKNQLLARTQASEQKYQAIVGNLRQQYERIEGDIAASERKMRQLLKDQDRLNKIDEGGGPLVMSWPVPSRYITSPFHDPNYPFRHIFEHNAIDVRASHGTPLKAAAPGYVARAKRCGLASCYSYTMIVHSDGFSTVYGHMSSINVSEDQFVGRGDIIGYSGGTPGTPGAGPFVTGAHLHFEVRKNGIPVNPLNYLIKDY